MELIKSITQEWGYGNPELFVSGQIMRPFSDKKKIGSKITKQEIFEMHMNFKDQIAGLIKDADKVPKPIVFVNRNMN